MLTAERLYDVCRLLAKGVSARRVAKTLRVSRGTVLAIAHGRHCPARARETEVAGLEGQERPLEAVRRCRGGGHLFHGAVCLTCAVRALAARRRFARGVGSPIIGIELTGEARRRWLALRATCRDRLAREAPRVLVHKCRPFRFTFGLNGLAFWARLHPAVRVEPAR